MEITKQDYSEWDRQIWEEELEEFVPSRIFDAHIHLYHRDHGPADCSWRTSDVDSITSWAGALYPNRDVKFLVLGTPVIGIDVAAHHQWQMNQMRHSSGSRVHRLVTPTCDIDAIRADVNQPGCWGLKPYRFFSSTGDADQCRISDFLTHEQMELADELGLWVTMHLSKFHGCADRQNLADLTDFTTRKYPNIKWILAHCARSFTYWPIRQAVEQLRDMPNIWYDLSAVTDVRPLLTLFQSEDLGRILYGSDGVDATYFRGSYVALGRAWQALNVDKTPIALPHCDGRPILAIYEQLLSMKHAAEIAQFSRADIEDVFWRNAAEAFQVSFGAKK